MAQVPFVTSPSIPRSSDVAAVCFIYSCSSWVVSRGAVPVHTVMLFVR